MRSRSSASAAAVPHLLLVDDTEDDIRLLADMLHAEFRLSFAFDGHQGYQRAVAAKPDLILMDVRMPRMDGFAACRLLKADPATQAIPVLFLSAALLPSEKLEGLRIGAVDYIAKPFEAEEVRARVQIHLKLAAQSRLALAAPLPPATVIADGTDDDAVLVRAAQALIVAHLDALPSLAEIASKVGTHEKRLTAAFRSLLGQTVFGYAREARIQQACRLLSTSSVSIDTIAAQVGFQTSANFSTAFKERMGVPPSVYRSRTTMVTE
ncbi:DNA-binding response regulator [Rhodoferax saidenbachensis]|uniref:DNA-binding response regulator n=1 Tax=Rhodoferax saidenbachensis TaxID=1484693 RepID=A0A1P8KGA4_9BURK|nr:DNA-binding response regulator [Rhodoferax saidenbachensis]